MIPSIHALTADGAPGPVDSGVQSLLAVAAFAFGWIAVARLRSRGFPSLSRGAAWVMAGLCVASVVAAVTVPPRLRREPAAVRPSSTARVTILSPRPGQVFRGNPAEVPVRVRLTGGRIVPLTSTNLVPNEGHLHVSLDGALESMTSNLGTDLRVGPGSHSVTVEFVAADHAPFSPRVRTTVRFTVAP
jgi:hypothetical protein